MKLFTDNQEHLLNHQKSYVDYLLIHEIDDIEDKLVFFNGEKRREIILDSVINEVLTNKDTIYCTKKNFISEDILYTLTSNNKLEEILTNPSLGSIQQLVDNNLYLLNHNYITNYDIKDKENKVVLTVDLTIDNYISNFHVHNGMLLYAELQEDAIKNHHILIKKPLYNDASSTVGTIVINRDSDAELKECYHNKDHVFAIVHNGEEKNSTLKVISNEENVLNTMKGYVSHINTLNGELILTQRYNHESTIYTLRKNDFLLNEEIYKTDNQIVSVHTIGKDLWDAYNGGAQ